MRGLRARGGFEVDITWQDGRLSEARIKSLLGQPCRIARPDAEHEIAINGQPALCKRDANGNIAVAAGKGDCVVLRQRLGQAPMNRGRHRGLPLQESRE